ncbi:hypothetical protein [Prosthecobacter sp.]|uniref:hypothetical protein n=1 Tax=Prosthecobacter sp. TaxID=1965333 RepID=UPI003784B6CE
MKAFFAWMALGLGCVAFAEKPAAAAAAKAQAEVMTNEPGEGLVIKERDLGLFERIEPEKTLFTPCVAVPLVENQGYGWRLKVETESESVVVRHELRMPAAPDSWVSLSPGTTLSEDMRTATSVEELRVHQGNLFQFWYFTEGDPEGLYEMRVFIHDRLVGEFKFWVRRPFPEQVRDFLDSEWTELSISTVVGSDDQRVTATCVRLNRESANAPVTYALPLGKAAPADARVKEEAMDELFSEVRDAAEAAYEHRYPLEVLLDLPLKRAWETLKSGGVKIDRSNVEMLIIRGKNAKGAVSLVEFGPCASLDETIQRLFQTKALEVKREERKKVLGVEW